MSFDIERDALGIYAPASFIEDERLEGGVKSLEDFGFKVKVHPQTRGRLRDTQSSGTHEEKMEALYDLLKDDDVGAIMAVLGGNRSLHYLDCLDYSLLDKYPKPLIGISDFTTILNGAYTHCSRPRHDVFGHVVTLFLRNKEVDDFEDQVQCLKDILAGKEINYPMANGKIVREGTATGKLLGGTQSVFQAKIGTDFFPDLEGAILFLEDVGEQTNRIDRLFAQLRLSGVLSKISGLIIGDYILAKESGRVFGFSIEDMLLEHTSGLDIPVVMGLPFGHGKQLYPLRYGGQAELMAVNGKIELKF